MPSRRDALQAGGLAAAAVLAGGAARYGAWSPAPRSVPEGAWLQPRYDRANTGHNPTATPPADDPVLAETYDAPEAVSALVADAEKLYAGTDHAVYAYEYGDQFPDWDRAASAYLLARGADAVVAVGEGGVAAFAPENGTARWTRTESGVAYSVLADRRTAYVGWHDQVAAYALADGDRRWSLETNGEAFVGFDEDRLLAGGTELEAYDARGSLPGVLADGPTRAWTADDVFECDYPVSAGGYTLVGTGSGGPGSTGDVTAVTAAGEREWRTELGTNAGRVASDGDRAYAVSMRYGEPENGYNLADTTTLHALDLESGDEQWSFQRPGWFAAPVVADGTVYVGERGGRNGTGNLYALDAVSGDERWTYQETAGVNVLAAAGDALFVGTDDSGVLVFE